jgi:hypothetical protein
MLNNIFLKLTQCRCELPKRMDAWFRPAWSWNAWKFSVTVTISVSVTIQRMATFRLLWKRHYNENKAWSGPVTNFTTVELNYKKIPKSRETSRINSSTKMDNLIMRFRLLSCDPTRILFSN